ncbi:MAG: PAS domain S-box protein [Myxococcota bacterium]
MSSAPRPGASAAQNVDREDDHAWVRSVSEAMARALRHTQAVVEFRPDGTIVRANEIYLNSVGYEAAEVEGQHRSMLLEEPGQDDALWTKLMAGEFVSTRVKRIAKGGRTVWLRADYTPVLDDAGQVTKVVKFAHDITQYQRRGVESRAQLQAINSIRARSEFALDGTILDVNERFCEIMRVSRDDVVGRSHFDFVDDRDAAELLWAQLIGGRSQSGIYRRTRKDGSTVWLEAFYAPVKDDDGTVLQVIAFAADVTDLETHRVEIEALTTAIDRSQARITFTTDGEIIEVNDNFLEAFGYQREELIGNRHEAFVSEGYGQSREYTAFWERLKQGVPFTDQVERYRKDGSRITLQATYAPMFDEPGRVTRIVKLASDITGQVEADRNLRRQVDELLQVSRKAANGDLTVDVTVSGESPGGRIGEALKTLIGAMQSSVSAISDSAGTVTFAAEGLAKTSTKIAGNAKETRYDAQSVASAAEALTRAITALESTTEQLRENITEIAGSSREVSTATTEAANVVKSAGAVIEKLGASGEAIGKLVTTITWIAEQTDMLALNASIEAARAGHTGRGFAVVAQEVKQLAKQTAGAAGQIRGMVEDIQSNAGAAVSSVVEVGSVIERINALQTEVGNAIEQQATTAMSLKNTLSEAAEDSDGIFGDVKKVVDTATDTSEGVLKIRTAARDLSSTASAMNQLVEKFRV